MRQWMPGIERRLNDWSVIYAKLGGAPSGDAGRAVDVFAKYEAERAKIRAGG